MALTIAQILDGVLVLALMVGVALGGRRASSRRTKSSDGRRLGPYTLGAKIGEGAMGEVFRARHRMLRRWCAIKFLPHDVTAHERRRFEQEVRLTAQLSHPNTVAVHDYGRAPDGRFYYAMELLDGISLQQLVQREGPQPAERVIHILAQVCGALGEAHAQGLVHRDIKPSNVLLCRRGGASDVAKLVDFGLVKRMGAASDPSESTKLLVGTPLYLSPEAIAAPEKVTEKSDLYALGAVAWFLLTGKTVFDGESVVEVCCHHMHSQPERPSHVLGREIDADLEELILECLEKDPSLRPGSAEELAERLSRCVAAPSPKSASSSGIRARVRVDLDGVRACA
jgi:serine/threonine-protein kinase